jgi:hypothetical protein
MLISSLLMLFPMSFALGDYCVRKLGRTEEFVATASIAVPVVIETSYSTAGVSIDRRGLFICARSSQ